MELVLILKTIKSGLSSGLGFIINYKFIPFDILEINNPLAISCSVKYDIIYKKMA